MTYDDWRAEWTKLSPWERTNDGFKDLGRVLLDLEHLHEVDPEEAAWLLKPVIAFGTISSRVLIPATDAVPGRTATVDQLGGWAFVDWARGEVQGYKIQVDWLAVLEGMGLNTPLEPAASSESAPPAQREPPPIGGRLKIIADRGGITEREFWKRFDKEVIRLTWDQEFSSKRGCVALMKTWVQSNVDDPPDDGKVRARVNALLPPSCPADDPPTP